MEKTTFVVLVLGALLAVPVFADEYAVQSVTGRVEREVSPGKWQTVVKGMTLDSAAVIDTGVRSQLVLNDGGRVLIITARQRGTVENLSEDILTGAIKLDEKTPGGTPAAQDAPASPR
jgi:hypothetical protein